MELTESSRLMRGARKVKMNSSWSCVPNLVGYDGFASVINAKVSHLAVPIEKSYVSSS